MLTLGDMDPSVFLYFMRSSAEGLRSLDSGIPAQVSVAIDSVFSFVFKYNSRRQTVMLTTPPNYLVQRIEDFPFVVTIMMSRLLEVLLFDDHPTQWSLTRPLLPLVLLNRDVSALTRVE